MKNLLLLTLCFMLGFFCISMDDSILIVPDTGGSYFKSYQWEQKSTNGVIDWKKKVENCQSGGQDNCTEGKCYFNDYTDGEPGEWVTPCPEEE